MARGGPLPLAPPPLPDETISSWLTRIAARYDLSADGLLQHLRPGERDVSGLRHTLNYQADRRVEAAIAQALDRPARIVAMHRLPMAAANPRSWWQRRNPAWCPVCVAEDVAIRGEVHGRRDWELGCTLMCARHRCLLLAKCPLCCGTVAWQPVKGRLRIWCRACRGYADSAVQPDRIPFWPYGTLAQQRSGRAVRLSRGAAALLLDLQADLRRAITGERPQGPWARSLGRTRLADVLSKLTFVMLGPLWAECHRPGVVTVPGLSGWHWPEDWTPGWLPPDIAAPALMAAATFLAAEGGTPLEGITWNPRVLLPGEDARISAETLLWHLNTHDARLVRDLFPRAAIKPLSLLLTALERDTRGLGRCREEARRRRGSDTADRRGRAIARARARETPSDRQRREVRDRDDPPEDRYQLHRVSEWFPQPQRSQTAPLAAMVTFAVYFVIGACINGCDLMADSGWPTPLLHNRYVRLWIARHRTMPAARIIALLMAAIETASLTESGSIVLPERPTAEEPGP